MTARALDDCGGSEETGIGPLLVGADKAAGLMSISPRKLWSLTKSGEVPHVRIGRRVMYRPESLRAWLAKQEQWGGGGGESAG
jgi:hypothetical protein